MTIYAFFSRRLLAAAGCLTALTLVTASAIAQPPGGARGPGGPGRPGGPGPGGPRGFGAAEDGRMGNMMRMFPVMAALDANSDGSISAEEIENASKVLKALDKNGDGQLSGEELRPQFPGGPGGPGEGRRRPGGRPEQEEGDSAEGGTRAEGRPGPGGRRGFEPTALVDRWMSFDSDDDGKLSREELMTMAKEQLERRPGGERERLGRGPGRRGPGAGDGSRRPERE